MTNLQVSHISVGDLFISGQEICLAISDNADNNDVQVLKGSTNQCSNCISVEPDDLLEDNRVSNNAIIHLSIFRQTFATKDVFEKKIGVLKKEKLKEILRAIVIYQSTNYYNAIHKPIQDKPFDSTYSRVNYAGRVFDAAELSNLVDSSLEFWLTYGKYSKRFENMLSDYLGVRWALLVNSGSSANLLAFMALTSPLLKDKQVKRGDEVITVAAGFPTTVAPIVQYGAVPVFVDIELKTANIDCSQLKTALSSKTKAVMIAHTLGNPFDVGSVKAFCNAHDLWLIEDNCDALDSTFDGKKTGTFGDIGTSSFYPPHHMTMGEGGATYTNDPLLKKIMLSLRDWGRDCWCDSGVDNTCGARFQQQFGTLPFGYDHKYVYGHFGYNLKATDMQAAIGAAQLEKLPSFTETRKNNFKFLYDGLKDLERYFLLPSSLEAADPSWFGFLLIVKDDALFKRNQIIDFLETHRIQTRNLFAGNIVRQPLFASLEQDIDYRIVSDLTNTDKIMNDGFLVGVFPGMQREALQYMIDTIHEFIDKRH